jgi:exoribonuclease R
MLDRFFPRSLFGTLPQDHNGIPARAYLRLKGNTYVGIVNQWILEALSTGEPSPFSVEDLDRISRKQNRQLRSYDSVSYQVRFIEMLYRNLGREGELFHGRVVAVKGDELLFEFDDPDFKKWGSIRRSPENKASPSIAVGDEIWARLEGFDRVKSRFRFSPSFRYPGASDWPSTVTW